MEPIVVVGCFCSATGVGESARLCYQALRIGGVDVYGIDVSRVLMHPTDLADFDFRDGRSIRGPGTLLVHVNAPLMPLVFLSLGRQLIRRKWIVGYWAWELPAVPAEWRVGPRFVHEVWVPSRFVAAAVRARIEDIPIRILPHAVACGDGAMTAQSRDRRRPFTGLVVFGMGSSFERKNPTGAVTAFREAFADAAGTRLIVKVTYPGIFPEGEHRLRAAVAGTRNSVLIERTLPRRELLDLFRQADCLLSLHRSEGFGLAAAEAMCLGVPAVSTDWSGTTDFVTAQTGCPVPFRLIPPRDPQGTYDHPDLLWADPDLRAAAHVLRELREGIDGLAENARDDARRRFNAEVYCTDVRNFLATATS